MVVMHTYLLRHMAGKTAANVWTNVRGGQNTCRWARNSTETEAECRLLLVTYYYYYYYYY